MRSLATPAENPTTALMPPAAPAMPWRVASVTPLPEYRLRVTFQDGTSGNVDLAARVHSPQAGVFACLNDPNVFAQVFVSHGAVTWPGEIDLAPDAMYRAIQASGTWVLR